MAGATITAAGCSATSPTPGASPSYAVRPALSGKFESSARLGRLVRWQVLTPNGTDPQGLPVVVFLHGKGGDHTMVDYWQPGLDEYARSGGTAMALAGIDAGNTYYHPRASGEDAGKLITDEFIPLLADQGLDTSRLAFAGMSMGGYGALRLAGLLGADRLRAVVVSSPALWPQDDEYAPGAFDSPRDHAQHNVFGRQDDLTGMSVRVDCGLADPFLAATRGYLNGFATEVPHSYTEGGHNVAYWESRVPVQLDQLGAALG